MLTPLIQESRTDKANGPPLLDGRVWDDVVYYFWLISFCVSARQGYCSSFFLLKSPIRITKVLPFFYEAIKNRKRSSWYANSGFLHLYLLANRIVSRVYGGLDGILVPVHRARDR